MAQQKQQKLKGNPASKRMQNPRRIARRAACWLRGQERKKLRKELQKEREAKNRKLRAQGALTPWKEAKKRRYDNRNV